MLEVEPFVEIANALATEVSKPSAFVPAGFYGSARQWSLSAGVRLAAGMQHARMGRYGAVSPRHEMTEVREMHE